MANQNDGSAKKTYYKKATGEALETVEKHSADHELKLFGSCFCPFVQRVWISLELKRLDYQYIENRSFVLTVVQVDPYEKPRQLLEVNPRGLVPALRHGDWGCYESTVLMEYLEDLQQGEALLPNDPKLKAHSRLWSDHINRNIVPGFYRYLQAQDEKSQIEHAGEFKEQISKLVDAADDSGPFFLGEKPTFVDVQMAPWVIRLRTVLQPYRGWPEPEGGSRWAKWVEAIQQNHAVRATTSTDELYYDSYERYFENRPNTSQVQKAINSGRGLP
ncbi:glutathione S-transferase [Aureobasidium sp. EXF-10728]|nr:glutathione S-transferase [Aureobasidium sp. EXF-10728]